MRLLVLGGTGMLGFQFLRTCIKRGLDVHTVVRSKKRLEGTLPQLIHSSIHEIDDIRTVALLDQLLQEIQPTHLVNCIGIVKQSELASDYIESITLNALLPHQLQLLAKKNGCKLIHISTDCVFSGQKGNYLETDHSDAYDLYGKSKFLGEVGYGNALTLRTSIIGHETSKETHGLVEWFLAQKGTIKGFKRAIFSGFTTLELTRLILDVAPSWEEMIMEMKQDIEQYS